MSASELLSVFRAKPFRPVRLCMSDGTVYEVRHPDLVIVAPGTAVVGYPAPDCPGAAARYDIVSLRHIARLEFIDFPEEDENADIREAYPLMDAVARQEGWDDPEMDSYDALRLPKRRLGMTVVKLDMRSITNWETFHDVFQQAFGFPEFYGRNMNAWVDCMTSVDEPETGMTSIPAKRGELVVLQLEHVNDFCRRCPEQYAALIECAAFVNWRRIEVGGTAVLVLSFYK